MIGLKRPLIYIHSFPPLTAPIFFAPLQPGSLETYSYVEKIFGGEALATLAPPSPNLPLCIPLCSQQPDDTTEVICFLMHVDDRSNAGNSAAN